jgi:hypothetical protein
MELPLLTTVPDYDYGDFMRTLCLSSAGLICVASSPVRGITIGGSQK